MDEWYTADAVSIPDLARALRDARLQWVYAERMEDTILTWREALLDGSVDLARWTHGRVFGPDLELAWWRRGEALQARAILSADQTPPEGIAWEPYPTEGWKSQDGDGRVLLLGECDPEAPADEPLWSTERIPRYLQYPIAGEAQRVALLKRSYRQRGVVVAWRLLGIEKVSHG